jgi:hypothetical protein
MSATVSVVEVEPIASSTERAQVRSLAGWRRYAVPSLADLVFVFLALSIAFGPLGHDLLNDAGLGWHIRTGEQILVTHAVPKTDPYSYTMAGRPWFAWEWLYDVVAAEVHHVAGLQGVRLMTALVVAFTFLIVYFLLRSRSSNSVVAAATTLLAAMACRIHLLARPHVFGWLLAVFFLAALHRWREGDSRLLWFLPVATVLWANLHGSFFLGLVLIAIFFTGDALSDLAQGTRGTHAGMSALVVTGAACALATLCTPYGYHLHVHIYQYLRSPMLDRISEFASPTFHNGAGTAFLSLVLLSVIGFLYGRAKASLTDLGLFAFAIWSALYSARNLPLAAVFLAYVAAPRVATALTRGADRLRGVCGAVCREVEVICRDNTLLEANCRGHLLIAACTLAITTVAVAHGTKSAAAFPATNFPAAAVDRLQALQVRDSVFAPDQWSSYMIYRMYPNIRVFFDDRSDFYGTDFTNECAKVFDVQPGWDDVLRKYHVLYVLMPPKAPLVQVLKATKEWTVIYSDSVAVLLQRQG